MFAELRKPYLLAHRGGADLAPMNTMAAFEVADAIGVDFLDIDVHLTRDGHVVGIHDSTVDATTNGRGRVDAYTLAELQALDAGYRFQDLHGEYNYRGKVSAFLRLRKSLKSMPRSTTFTSRLKIHTPKANPRASKRNYGN
ncbi:hypothetical protein KSX_60280 [Ktedonospora formicarum]|uniref:GP-PDE domain-containing protein n=1 Tax=Ktedonospora formicarum TaxID=2778364 RepID=A0A8J3I6P8_9CHLR|nr:hypothetical protein KSX_60280 [Ktedonospora formicarum]